MIFNATRTRFTRRAIAKAIPVLPLAAATLVIGAGHLAARLARGVWRLLRVMRHRREAAVLARLEAHMLADIGLTRADMRDAAAEPMWNDPTALLRARALERRLRQNGVSNGL